MIDNTNSFAGSLLLFVLSAALLGSGCTSTGMSAASLGSQLADNNRSAADQARDAGRKPAEVLAFVGISKGMTVLDMIAAGGYYSEVLSLAVGPEGKVYAQNPDFVLKMRGGVNDQELGLRLANNRLPNVVRWDRELENIGITLGSLDAAFTALNLHDIYNRNPKTAQGVLELMFNLLKPGGVMGIVDHNGDPGNDNSALHRMTKAQAIAVAEAAGFQVISSDLLANPADDHSQMVFATGLRGNTDRFVLQLRKPG